MSTVTTLAIAADHPAFSGHFPGAPILPGVVLLDATLRNIEQTCDRRVSRWHVAAAKFPSAVRPGEALTLEHEPLPNGSIRFVIRAAGRAVATGVVMPRGAPTECGDDAQA
jgi:3-hydroxymyristoyl/3-hydroxydecanoyl-(acyl carrier protein) dehydratase